jgi:hypothetical protein
MAASGREGKGFDQLVDRNARNSTARPSRIDERADSHEFAQFV